MILKDVVQWLLDNKYAVLVNGEIAITGKLQKDLQQETFQPKKTKRSALDAEYRKLWKDFVEEAQVPHAATAQNGSYYYLRPYSLGGVIELITVLNKKTVDKEKLIASTKHYYRTAAFKKTLLNYFRDGLWEEVYETYLASPKIQAGENPFDT